MHCVRAQVAFVPEPTIPKPTARLDIATATARSVARSVGFVADGLLSARECRQLIDTAEDAGLTSVAWEYKPEYRRCCRAVVRSSALADTLWTRLQSVLVRADVDGRVPVGFDVGGTWVPIGLNDVLRVSRYDKGGHFAYHRDTGFVYTDDVRSICSLLVYLNSDFEGGCTLVQPSASPTASPTHEMVVHPRVGRVLCLQQDQLHCGQAVLAGSKYILRTDVMFKRVSTVPRRLLLDMADSRFLQSMQLFDESIKLQADGLVDASTAAFIRAVELQAALAAGVPAECAGCGITPELQLGPCAVVADSTFQRILRHLALPELLLCCAVSHAWSARAVADELWLPLYAERYRPHAARCSHASAVPRWRRAADSDLGGGLSSGNSPWRTLFMMRRKAEVEFRAVVIDVGCEYVRYSKLGALCDREPVNKGEWGIYDVARNPWPQERHASSPRMFVPAKVRKARGHYWSALSSFRSYYVGDECHKRIWFGADAAESPFPWSETSAVPGFRVELLEVIVRWLFHFGFNSACRSAAGHPVLVAIPPWLEPHAESIEQLFRRLEAPFLRCIPSAVLAVRSTLRDSGLALIGARLGVWLIPVWRGEVLSAFQALHDFSAPALEMLRAASRLEAVRSDGDAEVHELDDALRMVASAAADGPMGACLRSLVFGAAVPLDVAVTALLQTLPQEQRLILRSNIVPSGTTAHVWAAELASRLHPSGCTVVQVTPASCAWSVLTGGEMLAAHHPESFKPLFPAGSHIAQAPDDDDDDDDDSDD